ncbi:MAG: glycosyltransferase family 4 protein [bacterium]|nr:glycosyltransferase family 4 protein [bacterium]
MRVLIVHNEYRQPGGEDVVFRAEARMLRDAGHEVRTFVVHNDDVDDGTPLRNGVRAIWNRQAAGRIAALVREHEVDVTHFHNTMPQLSPAVIRAARRAGSATVLTLHNYRLVCPAGTFFRGGKICVDCAGSAFPWPGVARGCYRGSRLATATVGATNLVHRLVRTWQTKVDRFIVLSNFAKQGFARAGLPAEKLAIKPNFLPRFAAEVPTPAGRRAALFLGRLSHEKGVRPMLAALEQCREAELRIAGDGPLAAEVEARVRSRGGVEWLGRCDRDRVARELGQALCLVLPSLWFEGLPMTLVEAFAAGVPVVAFDTGPISEIVVDGENGLLVPIGDAAGLAWALDRVASQPELRERLVQGARASYEARFTPERNLSLLERVYADALATRAAVPGRAAG